MNCMAKHHCSRAKPSQLLDGVANGEEEEGHTLIPIFPSGQNVHMSDETFLAPPGSLGGKRWILCAELLIHGVLVYIVLT